MSSLGVADSNPQVQTISFSTTDNITAKASGGQQAQSPLNASVSMHRITTVANNNDSVTMPPAKAGAFYVITNAAAANSANVFPNKGDAINALGANNAFALASNKVALFICVSNGQWHTITTA